jgi:adenosylmethionine-8-amino-7-oxononanoate aminotransferase
MFVDRGVWVRPFGRLVYVMPAYIMSDADLATLTAAMVAVMQELDRL